MAAYVGPIRQDYYDKASLTDIADLLERRIRLSCSSSVDPKYITFGDIEAKQLAARLRKINEAAGMLAIGSSGGNLP